MGAETANVRKPLTHSAAQSMARRNRGMLASALDARD
jgi:hypothetical protein